MIEHRNERQPAIVADQETVTYSDLHRLCDAATSELGFLKPGSVLACVMPNSVTMAVTALVAWRLNLVLAPISPRVPAAERTRLLSVLRPAAVATRDGVAAGGGHEPDEFGPRTGPEDALILFTSGSTGRPKAAVLSRANVLAGVRAVVDRFGLTAEDRTAATLPWTHGHGLIGVLLSALSAGGTVVVDGSRPVMDMLRSDPYLTWASVVPAQLVALCAAGSDSPAARWRFLRTASAPLNRLLAIRAEALLSCPVAEAYGMTETAHQAAANEPAFHERVPGSVGRPSPGLRVRCRGPRIGDGRELEVAGPSVFRGYLGDADATAAALAGGWYRTRDVGRVDADGRIHLLGRISEHINRAGNKISPLEVEDVLAEHPDIVASLVAGWADPEVGEEVGALIQLRPGAELSHADIVRHCRDRLAVYKHPRRIRVVAQIPTLDSGKPSRVRAAQMLMAGD
jgi:acyl-CoA synthetase (AMP-forming)/AMP-acid ligase II